MTPVGERGVLASALRPFPCPATGWLAMAALGLSAGAPSCAESPKAAPQLAGDGGSLEATTTLDSGAPPTEGDASAHACQSAADCLPGPEWTCALEPGHGSACRCAASGAERCDGRDNDCNGEVDEGAPCPGAATCEQGECRCSPEDRCGGVCVDRSADVAHCGDCDTVCPLGATCASGVCACPAASVVCGAACVDVATSTAHCGACDHACGELEACSSGQCACAHARCGGTCVSLDDDPANCGECGRDCNGSACVNGECLPVTLVEGKGVIALAVDGADLFWVHRGSDALWRSDLNGRNAVAIAPEVEPFTGSAAVAVHGNDVYWSTEGQARAGIWRMPRDGSAQPAQVFPDGAAYAFAFDATHIYFVNGDVYRIDLDGSNFVALTGPAGHTATTLGLAGGKLFFSDANNGGTSQLLGCVGTDGTNFTALARGIPYAWQAYTPTSIAVTSDYVYWSGFYSAGAAVEGIYRAKHDGTDRTLVAWGAAQDLVVADRALYWTNGYLQRTPLDGGDSVVLLRPSAKQVGSGSVRAIAQDSRSVYAAIDSYQGGIWRIAK